eukprot:Clim_evm74s215 gene=Clim_evmTU74s215
MDLTPNHKELSVDSLLQVEQKWQRALTLTVAEAKDLKSNDLLSMSDTYCVVKINGRETARTRTVWNTNEPEWQDESEHKIENDFDGVEVVLWEANRITKDEPRGKVVLPPRALRSMKPGTYWFPITSAKGEGSIRGALRISLAVTEVSKKTDLTEGIDTPGTSQAVNHGTAAEKGLPNWTLPVKYQLELKVKTGQDLSKDLAGKKEAEIYCVAHMLPDAKLDTMWTTKTAKKSSNPTFGDRVVYNLPDLIPERHLHISVWAKHSSDDVFMGFYTVSMADLKVGQTVNRFIMLKPKDEDLLQAERESKEQSKNLITADNKAYKPAIQLANAYQNVMVKMAMANQIWDNGIITANRTNSLATSSSNSHSGSLRGLLQLKSTSGSSEFPMGQLRLNVKYTEEAVVDTDHYINFIDFVMNDHYAICAVLGRTSSEREDTAKAIVRMLQPKGKAIFFVCDTVTAEIGRQSDAGTLFRGNSMASKAVDVFQKICGRSYMDKVLLDIISDIIKENKNTEIDPMRIGKKDNLEKNMENLKAYSKRVWQCIVTSAGSMPLEMRYVYWHIRHHVQEAKLPGATEETEMIAISGFLFLRFLCPAILGPRLFNLWNGDVPSNAARTCTLLAKIIQNLGNLVEFGDKEPYMKPMNEFIVGERENCLKFLDSISSLQTRALEQHEDKRAEDLDLQTLPAEQCSRVYHCFVRAAPTMQDRVTDDDEVPLVKELVDHLLQLSNLHDLEESQIMSRNKALQAPTVAIVETNKAPTASRSLPAGAKATAITAAMTANP